MIARSISKNSLLLGLFAAFTTAAIAGTYLITKPRIAQQEREAANRALMEIFPNSTHNNSLLDDFIEVDAIPELSIIQSEEAHKIYIARQNDEIVGYIFPSVAPEGYGDKIRLLVGVNKDETIAGVRVIAHRETPGLGDGIEIKKSDWITGFDGKSLSNPSSDLWKVKKDGGEFDQFTGATITPRTIVSAVKNTLEYYHNNAQVLDDKALSLTQEEQTHGQ